MSYLYHIILLMFLFVLLLYQNLIIRFPISHAKAHKHTHTHKYTHPYTHKHTYTHTYTYKHKNTLTHVRSNAFSFS